MKRYSLVRWSGVAFLLFALLQLNAAVSLFQTPRDIIPANTLHTLGLLSIMWAVLFGAGGFLSLIKHPNAITISAWLVLFYLLFNMFRQVVLTQTDYEQGRFPFLITVSTLLALIPLTYLVHHYWRRD